MFNVWINDGSTEMPKDDILYIVSKEGLFLKKKMGFFESMTPVDKVSILQPMESYASLDISPLPGWQFAQILYFFKAVYEKYSSEAIVILHYNQKNGRYLIEVPVQQVSGAAADYKTEKTHKYFERLGTIHSHANFSAFHSGVDDKDEFDWDGLHITIGNVNSEYFSLSTSITAGGKRFKVKSVDYINDIDVKYYEVKTTVSPKTVYGIPYGAYYGAYFGVDAEELKQDKGINEKEVETVTKKTSGYTINVPEKFLTFPPSWMRRVSKKTYVNTYYNRHFRNNNKRHYNSDINSWYEKFNKAVDKTMPHNINDIQDHYDFKKDGFSKVGNTYEMFSPNPDIVVDEITEEFSPCENCIHRDEKSDQMFVELLEGLDDSVLEEMGFKKIDDDNDGREFGEGYEGYDGY